jgi:23S rRNA (cytosine1962-C5)-methyltransferase
VESQIRSGHPWLFADSVREQNREGASGELAVIYDRQDRFLAIGLFDPDSPLRVRVLHAGKPVTIDPAWWRQRFREAVGRRDGMFDQQTTGYRCTNGESDGWPGLVLDRYDTTFVLKLYTAAWLPRLNEIADLLSELPAGDRIVLRLSRNIQPAANGSFGIGEGLLASRSVGEPASRSAPVTDSFTSSPARGQVVDLAPVIFRESGLAFEADVLRGQKTGFFLDQRENRRIVESLARGRDVLNAFSFTGGFSVYAARGGARSVTDIDISEHALAGARRNFSLNPQNPTVTACRHETIQADAFDWLERSPKRSFDLVILDPPSLARRESERSKAIAAYRNLSRAGIRRLRPGGILTAASCSAHVTAEEFFDAVRQAARQSGRTFAELRTTGHPPDHPTTFVEANYLKCIYFGF